MSKRANELFFMRPWAVKEDILKVISEIMERHIRGEKLSTEDILAKIGTDKKEAADYEIKGGVAYIPIYGVISKRSKMVRNISQPLGTSVQEIQGDLKSALKDDTVEKIVLDIDSPGGSVDGIAELSDMIFNARTQKPIIAYANGMMCSAAYWLGSSAEKIYASKSAAVGSIGVYSVIEDWTVANHNAGIKTEVIRSGKHKAAGHPDKPFTQEDRDLIQEEVNTYYDLFVDAIKRNRAMADEAAEKVATGKVFIGQKALDVGLVDAIEDFDTLSDSLGTGSSISQSTDHGESGLNIDEVSKDINSNTNKREEEEMKLSEITLDQLQAENPSLIASIKDSALKEGKEIGLKEGKEIGAKEGKDGAIAAATAERARVTSILKEAKAFEKMEDLARECIEKGDTVEVALGKFKDQRIKDLEGAAPGSAGPGTEETIEADKTLSVKEKAEKEWAKDAKLRDEFKDNKEAYIAFKENEAKGRVKILKK